MDVTITQDFLICGYVREKKSGAVLFVGPVMEFPCTRKNTRDILEHMGEASEKSDKLVVFFEQTPCMKLTTFWKNMVFLNYLLNAEEPPENYLSERIVSLLGPEIDIQKRNLPIYHNTQELDRQLVSCVRYGKVDELTVLLRKEKQWDGNMGVAGTTSISSLKNIMVSAVALIAREAVKGGMTYESALTASDVYLQKLDSFNTYDSIMILWRQMLLDYAEKVRKINHLNPCSRLSRTESAFIYDHIYEKLTLAIIAKSLGYSKSYLSRAFKRDTQKNISDFIRDVKMEEAKYLLTSSDKTLVEIAAALGFSSQTYFQTMFKELFGITPTRFREM